jgi:hypothetical protein
MAALTGPSGAALTRSARAPRATRPGVAPQARHAPLSLLLARERTSPLPTIACRMRFEHARRSRKGIGARYPARLRWVRQAAAADSHKVSRARAGTVISMCRAISSLSSPSQITSPLSSRLSARFARMAVETSRRTLPGVRCVAANLLDVTAGKLANPYTLCVSGMMQLLKLNWQRPTKVVLHATFCKPWPVFGPSMGGRPGTPSRKGLVSPTPRRHLADTLCRGERTHALALQGAHVSRRQVLPPSSTAAACSAAALWRRAVRCAPV